MELIGSLASPFVRRIRIALHGRDYKFTPINVFSEEGKQLISKHTTTGRVPLLIDGDQVIWDSYLIAEHLHGPYDIETKKSLFLVSEIADAGIQLFQLRKFGTDVDDEGEFSQNNLRRIRETLDHFEAQNLKWDPVGQWLFCVLEWLEFRNVFDWASGRPKLSEYRFKCAEREEAKASAPT